MKVIIVVAILTALCAVHGKHLKKSNWHHEQDRALLQEKLRLLKGEDNAIDHGPAGYKTHSEAKKKHLSKTFGHRGEQHWQNRQQQLHKKTKYGRKGEQKKAVLDQDDVRLQELDFEPAQQPELKPDFIAMEAGATATTNKVQKTQKKEKKWNRKAIAKKDKKTKKAARKTMRKAMKKAFAKGMNAADMHTEFVVKGGVPERFFRKFMHKYNKRVNGFNLGQKSDKKNKIAKNTP